MQTFTAPITGNYKLEVWGAMGGGWGSHWNAPGGYSGGWKSLSKDDILYVVCGGKGIDENHYTDGTSYNGGGITSGNYVNGVGGGGATHIATATGLLKELVDNKTAVICVAGGAGSNGGWASRDVRKYQAGGGLVGLGSPTICGANDVPTKGDTGGTQTGCGPDGIKGGFGYGGDGNDDGGAGGGGWYGGNGSGGGGVNASTHGGGGSGYIGGLTNATSIDGGKTFPKPGGGTEQGHRDHGYAIISWISPSL
ncbi:glycine rich domain-containing protein [Segatella albensis]|uniref:glycine rich domain-containing protein n=1 Tax=Segatella albensis TaxID=77768 RepID=UPI0009DF7787|nr:glycine rich domain-containing protein [Segatella albensis]